MTLDLSSALELAVPLLLALGAAFGWDAWSRAASPPRFQPYQVKFGWQVDPAMYLEQGLRAGRISGAIVSVHDRLIRVLRDQYHLPSREIARRRLLPRSNPDRTVEQACRLVRGLEVTYGIAARAEDMSRTDLWSRWRRPVWRAKSRRQFSGELSELDSVWPRLTRSAG